MSWRCSGALNANVPAHWCPVILGLHMCCCCRTCNTFEQFILHSNFTQNQGFRPWNVWVGRVSSPRPNPWETRCGLGALNVGADSPVLLLVFSERQALEPVCVTLGDQQTLWALDIHGHLWFRTGIVSKKPQGDDDHWWQVGGQLQGGGQRSPCVGSSAPPLNKAPLFSLKTLRRLG